MEDLWAHTQEPSRHAPWDLRFSAIEYLPRKHPGDPQRFRYATRIGFNRTITGWGESVASLEERRSVLKFGSDDPLSFIREGAGFWEYQTGEGRCALETVYDYRTRGGLAGRWLDRGLFRPLMVWSTRWSFDRLRLQIERGMRPELTLRLWLLKVACRCALGLVWCTEGLVPKILAVSSGEVELVRGSGLVLGSPLATLHALGMAELLFGAWVLTGLLERVSVSLSVLGILGLGGLVAWLDPSALANPLGGLTKNLGLLACAAVVLGLEPLSPKAGRARP